MKDPQSDYSDYWEYPEKLRQEWLAWQDEAGSDDSFSSWLTEKLYQRDGLIEALSQRVDALVAALAEINQLCREDIERGNEASGLRLLTLAAINKALSDTKEESA